MTDVRRPAIGLRLATLSMSAVVLCTALPAAAGSTAIASCGSDRTVPTAHATRITQRTTDFLVPSEAMGRDVAVRVILPKRVRGDGRTPTLYLLHGTNMDPAGTADLLDVEGLTAGHDVAVVLPDGGRGGFYSDWWNYGQPGGPKWERFHTEELVRWVEATLPVQCGRQGRMIAGISMGGFGALSYAARHPDLYAVASSFSGAVDTNYVDPIVPEAYSAWSALDGGIPSAIWGSRTGEEVRWRGHNPADLAENLAPLADLRLYTGDGRDGNGLYTDSAEGSAYQQTTSMHERLQDAGVPHQFRYYGPGAHAGPFWADDLADVLATQLPLLRRPLPEPERVTYRSIEPTYGLFGWQVEMRRDVLELSRLADADATGFRLHGSGRAVVRTPANYRPGQRVRVDGASPRTAFADRTGRLTVHVDLGPSRTTQQYRGSVAMDVGPRAGGGPFGAPPNPVPEQRLLAAPDFAREAVVRLQPLPERSDA